MFSDPQHRLDGFTRVLALSVLACFGFSWKLWLPRPYYPLVPVAAWLEDLPSVLSITAFSATLVLLGAIAVWPRATALLWWLAAIWGLLLLEDQNRWWPSFYQFYLAVLLIAAGRRRCDDQEAGRVLAGLEFLFAAIYFYSGLQKLNAQFLHDEFPWFVEPVTRLLGWDLNGLPWVAVAAALVEMLVGVGLLTKRFRAVALYLALLMHLVIFFCIGPLRSGWNNSAWIWNLTVAVQVWLLFHRSPRLDLREMFGPTLRQSVVPAAVVLLVGMAPLLNNFNRWDSALSFNVYSGNVDYAEIHLSLDAARSLPEELAPYVELGLGQGILYLNRWTQAEFNANPYPETRVFLAVFRRVCELKDEGTATLIIQEKSGWWMDRKIERYDCPEVLVNHEGHEGREDADRRVGRQY